MNACLGQVSPKRFSRKAHPLILHPFRSHCSNTSLGKTTRLQELLYTKRIRTIRRTIQKNAPDG